MNKSSTSPNELIADGELEKRSFSSDNDKSNSDENIGYKDLANVELDPIMKRIRQSEREFIPNMPKLKDLNFMSRKKMIKLLCTTPTSIYRGFPTSKID